MCSSSSNGTSRSSSPGDANKGGEKERKFASGFELDTMVSDASLSPLAALTRPSRLVLRVSIAFALLSACCGWMLSGTHVSNIFRAARAAPWKKSAEKVCVLCLWTSPEGKRRSLCFFEGSDCRL